VALIETPKVRAASIEDEIRNSVTNGGYYLNVM